MKMLIYYLSLFLLGIGLIACQDDLKIKDYSCKVKAVKGDPGSIVGTWKLVKVHGGLVMDGPLEVDYSCDQILYEFRADNTLLITSDIGAFRVGMPGEYPYEFRKIQDGSESGYELTVDGYSWSCFRFEPNRMSKGNLAVDEAESIFIRIK